MVAFGYSRAARVAQRLAQPRGQTSVCAQARVGGARLCARLPGDLRKDSYPEAGRLEAEL